jgi:hypothetical protein
LILIYTFYNWNGLTYKAVRALPKNSNVKKLYIRGVHGAHNLVSHVLKNNYSHILGLGDYRRTARRIRIEERFINKYGKNKIIKDGPKYCQSTWEIPLRENMYSSDKASWGPCNRSAYMLSHAIKQNNLDTKLAFVHIPKSYKKGKDLETAELVTNWINSFSTSQISLLHTKLILV